MGILGPIPTDQRTTGCLLQPSPSVSYRTKIVLCPMTQLVKNLPANARDARDMVGSLGQKDPLEKQVATHSRIFA